MDLPALPASKPRLGVLPARSLQMVCLCAAQVDYSGRLPQLKGYSTPPLDKKVCLGPDTRLSKPCNL